MNRSESKYFNIALRLDEALIALLEEKDPGYITVLKHPFVWYSNRGRMLCYLMMKK